MFNEYTWGQFGLFIVVTVLLYYVVVGVLYYRDDFGALLTRKKAPGPLAVAPARGRNPPLVQARSAFAKAAPTAAETSAEAEAEAAEDAESEAGAAQNLPVAAEPVVMGALPSSTATATGLDDSSSEASPMDAAASVVTADAAAALQDETRTEDLDQADEQLAKLIRQKAYRMPVDSLDSDVVIFGGVVEKNHNFADPTEINSIFEDVNSKKLYDQVVANGNDPLAAFHESIASLTDLIPGVPEQLSEAEEVAAYIALVQAGEEPPVPSALVGTSLAQQMADLLGEEDIDE